MCILYTGVDIVAGDVMIVSRNNVVDKAIVSKAEAISKVIRRIKGVNGIKSVDGIKTTSSIKAVIKSVAIDRALTVSGSRTVARAHERIEAVGSINAVDSIKAIEKAKAIHGSRDFLRNSQKDSKFNVELTCPLLGDNSNSSQFSPDTSSRASQTNSNFLTSSPFSRRSTLRAVSCAAWPPIGEAALS